MSHIVLTLRDFQSHKNTVFSSSARLICVTGANSVGKSSLIRALHWILEDIRGRRFIRDGATRAEASLTINGKTVTRSKGTKENRYVIDEVEYNDINYGAPRQVVELLDMRPLKIDQDYEVNLNVADQLSPHFLVLEKDSIKAKFLGSLTGLNRLDATLRETNREFLEVKQQTAKQDLEVQDLRKQLEGYSHLTERKLQLDNISKELTYIKNLQVKIEELVTRQKRARDITEAISTVKSTLTVYLDQKRILVESNIEGTELLQKVNYLGKLTQLSADRAGKTSYLFSVQAQISKYRGLLRAVTSEDTSTVLADIQTMHKLEQLSNTCKSLLSQVATNFIEQNTHLASLATIKEQLVEARKVYLLTLKYIGICPTCGQSTSNCQEVLI